MLDWAWAYWTHERHARIVSGRDETDETPGNP
jgi:NADH dehydrogenase